MVYVDRAAMVRHTAELLARGDVHRDGCCDVCRAVNALPLAQSLAIIHQAAASPELHATESPAS